VHGLRRVDDIRGLNQAIPSESSSLAGWPLVVVNLDSHSRKGFPFGLVLEVVNDYPEVIKDQASAINLSFVDSRIILELKHISHNRFYCLTVLVNCQHLFSTLFALVAHEPIGVSPFISRFAGDVQFLIASAAGYQHLIGDLLDCLSAAAEVEVSANLCHCHLVFHCISLTHWE
jgi:hypothetical protein